MLLGAKILSLMSKGRPHMNLTSQLTALKNQSRDLTLAERAELCCRLAKQLELQHFALQPNLEAGAAVYLKTK